MAMWLPLPNAAVMTARKTLLLPLTRAWTKAATAAAAATLSTSCASAAKPHTIRPQHPFWERKKMLAVSKPR